MAVMNRRRSMDRLRVLEVLKVPTMLQTLTLQKVQRVLTVALD